MIILPDSAKTFLELVGEYRSKTRQLETEERFPIARLKINFTYVDRKNYSDLIAWCGEQNTQNIAKKLCDFQKSRIVLPKEIVKPSDLNQSKKSDVHLLRISECLYESPLFLNPMDLFQELKENPTSKEITDDFNDISYASMNVKHELFPGTKIDMQIRLYMNHVFLKAPLKYHFTGATDLNSFL